VCVPFGICDVDLWTFLYCSRQLVQCISDQIFTILIKSQEDTVKVMTYRQDEEASREVYSCYESAFERG
jgi:hypothetical protein